MVALGLQELYTKAKTDQVAKPAEAISQLRDLVLGSHPNDIESIKVRFVSGFTLGAMAYVLVLLP